MLQFYRLLLGMEFSAFMKKKTEEPELARDDTKKAHVLLDMERHFLHIGLLTSFNVTREQIQFGR
jgi:hypothetical protein